MDGPAQISSDGGRTFAELRPTETPGKGEVLRTDGGSRLSVALLPNCLVYLDWDTAVEIVRLNLVKDGNETGSDIRGRFAELRLINGRIFVSHLWGEAPARLVIPTPHGEVSTPTNAAFWVEFAEAKTRVTCVSGWIEFRPTGAPDSSRVRPGSVGQWPSADGNISTAEADSRGQDDVQKAIELEQQMRALISEKRNILPR
jgi:ferric-dicitrate binding protein FerR (iron transport regulator)